MPTEEEPNRPFYLTEVQFQPDDELYYRIFAELFIYLRQYKPVNPWQVVIIYPYRRIEAKDQVQFQELLNCDRVTRIYLDELEPEGESTLGLGVVKLILESETAAVETAKRLIAQAATELTNPNYQRDLIELIETIIIYKLTTKSREEIAAMLELKSWKDNRFYQESFAEGQMDAKIKAVKRLKHHGLTLEAIAESLELPLDLVREAAEDSNSQEN
jgi:predicted transposase/invertase (TIGR01784 family)